jgi:hypothetical protein
MKPKILRYGGLSVSQLAIMKNGYVIDIACSHKHLGMFSEGEGPTDPSMNPFSKSNTWTNVTKVQTKDLALYTHWPQHTKEFWDLLNET